MRFLADESCDFSIVRALRMAGHDVTAVSEIAPGADDSDIAKPAIQEKRILLTEDKDFGQLAFSHGRKAPGVIFLRFPISARKRIARDVVRLIKEQESKLTGCFITVQPGKIRIGRVPEG